MMTMTIKGRSIGTSTPFSTNHTRAPTQPTRDHNLMYYYNTINYNGYQSIHAMNQLFIELEFDTDQLHFLVLISKVTPLTNDK